MLVSVGDLHLPANAIESFSINNAGDVKEAGVRTCTVHRGYLRILGEIHDGKRLVKHDAHHVGFTPTCPTRVSFLTPGQGRGRVFFVECSFSVPCTSSGPRGKTWRCGLFCCCQCLHNTPAEAGSNFRGKEVDLAWQKVL